jgi:hypothetical protein
MEPARTRGTVLAWSFALAWAILPAAPALARGELIGHGLTDLYLQAWGMWFLGTHAPLVPTHTTLFGFPDGMPIYVQSVWKGWVSGLFLPWLGVVGTYDLLTIVSRALTVGCAFHAARAWGLRDGGALVAAAVFGASPYFQGYSVEGIAECMDGWPLALWAWAVARERTVASILATAMCVVANFYLGAAACLLAVLAFPLRRKAPLSLAGIVLAYPAIVAFLHTLVGGTGTPLTTDVRAAMGAHVAFHEPGSFQSFHPFANTTWVGGIAVVLAVVSRSRLAWAALVPFALSFGGTPVYAMPVFSLLRFPYRWHAATLAILGLAAGRGADRFRMRTGVALALAIVAEGLALSPIEPILPGADGTVPRIYAQVAGPLLELPGPLVRAPGEPNPSRPRLRYVTFFQTGHHQPSPWLLDLNGLMHGGPRSLDFLWPWDPESGENPTAVPADLVGRLQALGVRDVMVQTKDMGRDRAQPLLRGFRAQGASQIGNDGERVLLRLPDGPHPSG